jgi:hypothetical protein
MNEPTKANEDEAMDALAAANPVRNQPEAGGARAGRIYTAATRGREKAPMRLKFAAALGALTLVGGLSVVGVVSLNSGGGTGPGDDGEVVGDPDQTGGGLAASCIGFSDEELRLRQFAFAGTATAVDGPLVTFAVDEWMAGGGSDSITLELDSTLLNSMYTEFTVTVGERYLVSGDEQFAWGCGFTVPYEESVAEQWAAALSTGGGPEEQSIDIHGSASLSCVALYSTETLVQREHAFDGELVEVVAQPVPDTIAMPLLTFRVREWFRGPGGDVVTLRGSGLAISYGAEDEGAVLQEGSRYLVSGDGDFAWACGFTKTYTQSMADQWRDATR